MIGTGATAVSVSDKPPKRPRHLSAAIPDLSSLFSLFKPSSGLTGLAAVGVTGEGVSLAYVDRTFDPPGMEVCDYKRCYSKEEQPSLLRALVDTHGLRGARCTTVMEPGTYSLQLVDAPNVAPDEMHDALRWRVKELIDFPVEEAVIDVFDVPGRNLRGHGGRMLYVVAARAAEVARRIELIEGAGLTPDVIDVPELAMRNVAALLPEDWDGVALLHLGPRSGRLILTRRGILFLAREIHSGTERLQRLRSQDMADQGRDASALNNALDGIVLEVQRALDYYERHSLNPPVSAVVATPVDDLVPGFAEYIAAGTGIEVRPLGLEGRLQSLVHLRDDRLRHCVLTVGAALRDG